MDNISTIQKWPIAIISTDKDLSELRTMVRKKVEEWGFKQIAYEDANYPIQPHRNSHDVCLLNVEPAEIVILLIDKNYGGLYREGPDSITKREFITAKELNKVIIPCICNRAWAQYQVNKQKIQELRANKSTLSVEDAQKMIPLEYFENWHVNNFIHEICTDYKDNFIVYYSDKIDLENKIKGKLAGFTRHFCQEIVKKQIITVENIRTTTLTLSIRDVLNKGYFIDPPYTVKSGDPSDNAPLSQMCDLSNESKTILLLGEPGIGKSTILIKSYLNHAKKCIDTIDKLVPLPFYISLRGIGPEVQFDPHNLLEDHFKQLLNRELFPLFDLNQMQFVFYIDGFDEIKEHLSESDINKIVRSPIFSKSFIVNSRDAFYHEKLSKTEFRNKIQFVIELNQWKKTNVKQYLKQFFKINKKRNLAQQIITEFKNTEMEEVLQNPLLLTMFAYIILESGMEMPSDIRNKLILFEKFIDTWIHRELDCVTLPGAEENVERIKSGWQLAAWEIYQRRFNGEFLDKNQLNNILILKNPALEEITKISRFFDFLDIRPYTLEVRGMFHEQFLEYLLAKEIVRCCKDKQYPFPDFLQLEIRHEINTLVNNSWKSESAQNIKLVLDNLWELYSKYLSQDENSTIAARNHIMYYLGRLPGQEANDKLLSAYNDENEIFVKISILFALMKKSNFEKEAELLNNLNFNQKWDETNRGYHLVYYGDWKLENQTPPYLDDGRRPWGGVYENLLRHLLDNKKYVPLKRIDIFTIRRLIEVRKNATPLKEEDVQNIRKTIDAMENKPKGFKKLVKIEFEQLEIVFNRYKKGSIFSRFFQVIQLLCNSLIPLKFH